MRFWRYRDDFRIAASSWIEAREIIAALDRELRSIGLTLNEEKTFTHKLTSYQRWMRDPEDLWNEIMEKVDTDLRDFDFYADEEPVASDEDEQRWVQAADQALDYWTSQPHRGAGKLRERTHRLLLKLALEALTRYSAPVDLTRLLSVVATEQHLTPLVGRYLRSIAPLVPQEVSGFLRHWATSERRYLSDWQKMWLLEPLVGGLKTTPAIMNWVKAMLHDPAANVLRARAALVVALAKEIAPEEVADLYSEIEPASQPDVVAAMARLADEDSSLLRAIASESPFNRWIIEVASPG